MFYSGSSSILLEGYSSSGRALRILFATCIDDVFKSVMAQNSVLLLVQLGCISISPNNRDVSASQL